MATTIAVTIQLETKEIMNVLFLEHDKTYRESITRFLLGYGCSVHSVESPRDAAALLEPNKYHLVIADIVFDPPDIYGDEFLISNRDILSSARMVALTGQRDFITYKDDFQVMRIDIVDKGDETEELDKIISEVLERRKVQACQELDYAKNNFITGRGMLTEGHTTEKLEIVKQVKKRLLKELRKIPDQEEKVISYKGKMHSVADLIREIENDTQVGIEHLRMMLNLEATRNVGKEDKANF